MKHAACLVLLAAALTSARAEVPEAAAPCPDAAAPKVAFVFEGAQREPHRAALRSVAQQLGSAACVRAFDHLSSGVDPDANARFLLGSLGLERYALVFLLTPRHAETMGKVVRQFPDTTYLHLGGRAQAANLVPYRLGRKADSASFYRAAVQCALAGKPLKAPHGNRSASLCS